MSSQLNPQQVAAWRAAMNAYIQGKGPQPNWYNYFTVGQTQAFSSGNASVSSTSKNSTPGKISAALNTQESQNAKVIADNIEANITGNTDLERGATKQQQQQQTQQPQQPQILSDFGNAAKTTTTLKVNPPPAPVGTPGPETPQSKGLNLGQAALSGNETKTPILGSGSIVTPLSNAVEIATPVKTPINTPAPTPRPEANFVSTNPDLRSAILQEWQSNPKTIQYFSTPYLQSLVSKGILSENEIPNMVHPAIIQLAPPVEKVNVPPSPKTVTESTIKSSNPQLESELVSNITAHPENYANYENYLNSLGSKGVLLQSDIDKINAAFLNYHKEQETKISNYNNGISTNPELEQAIIQARTSNPGAFANINPSYLTPLMSKGVITKPDITILNNSVDKYNKQVDAANQPFKSTNEGLREAILTEYATNPGIKIANSNNYISSLQRRGIISDDDATLLQHEIIPSKTPLPKTGLQTNPIGEFIKGSNIEINEYLTQAKGFYNYVVSGGKDNNIPSSTDVISKAISAPFEAYTESKEYGVPYGSALANQGREITSSFSSNPARALGQLLPTVVLSLIPVGDIAVGIKNTVPFLKSLLTGSTEANTAREIVGDVISKPVAGIGKNGEQVITKVPSAPYTVEKTTQPGIYRFYVGSGNDVVETGKELTPLKGLPTSTKYSPPPESTLVKAPKVVAPEARPSYVAAGVLDFNKGTIELYTPETTVTKTIPNKILGTGNVEARELQLMRATKINNNAFEVATKTNPSVNEAADIMPKSTYVHPTTLQRINEAIQSGNAKETGTGLQFDLESFQKYPNEFRDFITNGPHEKTVLPEPSAISKIIAVKRFGAGSARGVTEGNISVGGKQFDEYLRSLSLNPGYEERSYSFSEKTKINSLKGPTASRGNTGENGQGTTKTLQQQVKEITTTPKEPSPSLEISKPITGTIPMMESAQSRQESDSTTTTITTPKSAKVPSVRNLYKGIMRLNRIRNSNPANVIEQNSTLKAISKSNAKMINDLAHLPGTDVSTIPDLEESNKKKTKQVVDLEPLNKTEDLTKLGTFEMLNKKQSNIPDLGITPKNILGLKNSPKVDLSPEVHLTTIPKVGLTHDIKLAQVPALKIVTPQPGPVLIPSIPENSTGSDIIQPFKFKKLGNFGMFGEGSTKKGSKVHVYYDINHLGNVKYSAREFTKNPFSRKKKKR